MLRFQASGSENLRTFTNYHYVTHAPFKILVATVVGAVISVIGGILGAWMVGNQSLSRAQRPQ